MLCSQRQIEPSRMEVGDEIPSHSARHDRRRKTDSRQGMAGQDQVSSTSGISRRSGTTSLSADELGYASYGHNEHHLQIEGFEITNHPGMFSLFVGLHSQRMKVATLGYVLPTHNPVRAAEEIATLDHMLKGRLMVGFTRGYQGRWVDSYAAVPGIRATTPDLAKSRDEIDNHEPRDLRGVDRDREEGLDTTHLQPQGQVLEFPPEGGLPAHPAYAKYGAGMAPTAWCSEIGIAPPPLPRSRTRPSTERSRTACAPSTCGPARAASRSSWPTSSTSAKPCGTATSRTRRKPAETSRGPRRPHGEGCCPGRNPNGRQRNRRPSTTGTGTPGSSPLTRDMPMRSSARRRDLPPDRRRPRPPRLRRDVGAVRTRPPRQGGKSEELYRLANEVIPRFSKKDDEGTWV